MELRVGVLGFGTVGSGTVRLLLAHAGLLEERTGVRLRVVRIATVPPIDARDIPLDGIEIVEPSAVDRVVAGDDIDVVVELIGGIHPAKELIEKALRHGKSVVTANKALIAEHGNGLFALAAECGVDLAFEAAVAGTIPIIRALKEGLVANRVTQIHGILNGTCNYILTEMREKGLPFDQVLQDAQRMGYAEADPTLDIDGIDAAHKLAILAAIAFGTPLDFDSIAVEGIRHISDLDIHWATEMGYQIKLLGIARQGGAGLDVRVQPVMIRADSMLGAVNGVFNAVAVQGDFAGTTLFYGRGAGERPTASAVVADLVEIARNRRAGAQPQRVTALSTLPAALRTLPVCSMDDRTGEYYIRLSVQDRPGVLADITRILKDQNISLKAIRQNERSRTEAVPLVMVTHATSERRIVEGLQEIGNLPAVLETPRVIRIEHLDS